MASLFLFLCLEKVQIVLLISQALFLSFNIIGCGGWWFILNTTQRFPITNI